MKTITDDQKKTGPTEKIQISHNFGANESNAEKQAVTRLRDKSDRLRGNYGKLHFLFPFRAIMIGYYSCFRSSCRAGLFDMNTAAQWLLQCIEIRNCARDFVFDLPPDARERGKKMQEAKTGELKGLLVGLAARWKLNL